MPQPGAHRATPMRPELIALVVAACQLGAAGTSPGLAQSAQWPPTPFIQVTGQSTPDPKDEPTTARGVHWDFSNHPRLVLSDETFIDFRLKLQWDYRTFSPLPDDPADDTEWSLRRVGVEGQVTRYVEFEASFEIDDPDEPWRAVYVNARPFAALQVQGGHFKVPFSRERLTGPTNLDFTQRAVGVRLIAPGYDTGLMVHGRVWNRRVRYAAGVFGGAADEIDSETDVPSLPGVRPLQTYDDQLWAWRVTLRPLDWKAVPAWLRRVEVGANAAYSHVDEGRYGWRGRAVFGQEFFPAVYVNGKRTRYGADAELEAGPVALRWEYLRGLDERLGQGVADDDLPELDVGSWFVAGAVVVTGERKADVERPRRPLLRGGVGAIEAVARVEHLTIGSRETLGEPASYSPRSVNLAGNRDTIWTVGVNWYPDRLFKVQVDAIRERFEDRTRTLLGGQDTFWSYVVRVQFVL